MKRPGIIGPLFLIAVGVIVLFNNLGLLPWSIWRTLWNYWPVILILAGLDIIVSHTDSRLSYVLGVVLGLLIIVGVIVLSWVEFASPANSDLKSRNLEDKDLSGVFLIGRDLSGLHLEEKDMRDATMIGVNLDHANLQKTMLRDAVMVGINLNEANLTHADLTGAVLIGINLKGANLCNATLEGARLWALDTSDSTICSDCTGGPCW